MNATQQAQKAYGTNQHSMRPPRAIEAQLMSEITARLSRENADFPTRVAAVHDNRRMWNTLASDVASNDNGLPPELRAKLFYLAEFTEIQSQKFLRGQADLSALIDVNIAVLRGLNRSAAVS